jgi:hypothetical protein
MSYPNPQSLEVEHQGLHVQLERVIQAGGEVGMAASAVADVLHAHFVGEERYALPPLALLPALAAGQVEPSMAAILPLTDTLRAELPQMLAEHQALVGALGALDAAAQRAGNADAADFVVKLKLHAQNEEEILYPAALLVGAYLKLALGVPTA